MSVDNLSRPVGPWKQLSRPSSRRRGWSGAGVVRGGPGRRISSFGLTSPPKVELENWLSRERHRGYAVRDGLSGLRNLRIVHASFSRRRASTRRILRSWRQAWRITCPVCQSHLRAIGQGSVINSKDDRPSSPFLERSARGGASARRLRRARHSDVGVPRLMLRRSGGSQNSNASIPANWCLSSKTRIEPT